MKTEVNKYILERLNTLSIFSNNQYKFYQIKFIDDKILNPYPENLGFYAENKLLNINISLNFVYNLQNSPNRNEFIILIMSLNNFKNLNFDRYISAKYGIDSYEKLSLNNYSGNSLIEKITLFFNFLEWELSQVPLNNILSGSYWTDDFHFNPLEDYK
jgi:hypothetical protein